MRLTRGYKSEHVEDRRAQGPVGAGRSGGLGASLLGMLFRRFGLLGVLAGAALLYFAGGDLAGLVGAGSQAHAPTAAELATEQPVVELVSFVFDDAQQAWTEHFARDGERYELATLVLFRGATHSACGRGQAAMGPFYCSGDHNVYIDLSFYEELKQRLGAPGDFAQAYVIAHEVGHHVQQLLGQSQRVHALSSSEQAGERGALVRLELQADCYAGVWTHGTERRELLEVGDIDEALTAASKIGDDALQKQATGVVRPESFTHGTSAQRSRWFRRGLESGKPSACDTFSARTL